MDILGQERKLAKIRTNIETSGQIPYLGNQVGVLRTEVAKKGKKIKMLLFVYSVVFIDTM